MNLIDKIISKEILFVFIGILIGSIIISWLDFKYGAESKR